MSFTSHINENSRHLKDFLFILSKGNGESGNCHTRVDFNTALLSDEAIALLKYSPVNKSRIQRGHRGFCLWGPVLSFQAVSQAQLSWDHHCTAFTPCTVVLDKLTSPPQTHVQHLSTGAFLRLRKNKASLSPSSVCDHLSFSCVREILISRAAQEV